jgi:hypothetical protein
LVSSTKVATDFAAPYWLGQSGWFGARFRGLSLSSGQRQSPLRYAACLLFAFPYGIGHVQCAVAGVKLVQVRVPVVTRTDNIQIIFFLPGSEPARAGPIAISPLIYDKTLDQLLGKLHIGIEMIAGRFGFPEQSVIQLINFIYGYLLFIHF